MGKPAEKTPNSFGTHLNSAKKSIKSKALQILPAKETIKSRLSKWPIHVWLFLIVLIATLIIGGVYIFLSPSLRQKLFPKLGPQNVWVPSKPTPRPLAHGKQIYNISGGTKGAPQMTKFIIDPIDPKPEETQTITIKARDSKPITEIKVTIITDNKNTPHTLERIEGTELNGVWQGSWQIDDTYDYKYQAKLEAKNNANLTSIVTPTFR